MFETQLKDRNKSSEYDGNQNNFSSQNTGSEKKNTDENLYEMNSTFESEVLMGKDEEYKKTKNNSDQVSGLAAISNTYPTDAKTQRNFTAAIGGTLSLPSNANQITYYDSDSQNGPNGVRYKVVKGGVKSFTINKKTYTATFKKQDKSFTGYKDHNGNLYTGESEVFEKQPWYYYENEYSKDKPIKWLYHEGEIFDDKTKFVRAEAETRLFQATLALGITRLKAVFKITGMMSDIVSVALTFGGATQFEVFTRNVYQYTIAREWYGKTSSNLFNEDNSVVIPTSTGLETKVRVGVAKKEFQLYFQKKPLDGVYWFDVLDALETPTKVDPPKSVNKMR